MKHLILLLSITFMMSSCVSKKKIATNTQTVESLAATNFKSDYKVFYNKSYDFAAVTKKIDIDTENRSYILKTMVYDIENNKIIWGKKAIKGKVEWISKYELKINFLTKEKKRNTIIFNAKTKEVSYL